MDNRELLDAARAELVALHADIDAHDEQMDRLRVELSGSRAQTFKEAVMLTINPHDYTEEALIDMIIAVKSGGFERGWKTRAQELDKQIRQLQYKLHLPETGATIGTHVFMPSLIQDTLIPAGWVITYKVVAGEVWETPNAVDIMKDGETYSSADTLLEAQSDLLRAIH